jgi:hypothetical protein
MNNMTWGQTNYFNIKIALKFQIDESRSSCKYG